MVQGQNLEFRVEGWSALEGALGAPLEDDAPHQPLPRPVVVLEKVWLRWKPKPGTFFFLKSHFVIFLFLQKSSQKQNCTQVTSQSICVVILVWFSFSKVWLQRRPAPTSPVLLLTKSGIFLEQRPSGSISISKVLERANKSWSRMNWHEFYAKTSKFFLTTFGPGVV